MPCRERCPPPRLPMLRHAMWLALLLSTMLSTAVGGTSKTGNHGDNVGVDCAGWLGRMKATCAGVDVEADGHCSAPKCLRSMREIQGHATYCEVTGAWPEETGESVAALLAICAEAAAPTTEQRITRELPEPGGDSERPAVSRRLPPEVTTGPGKDSAASAYEYRDEAGGSCALPVGKPSYDELPDVVADTACGLCRHLAGDIWPMVVRDNKAGTFDFEAGSAAAGVRVDSMCHSSQASHVHKRLLGIYNIQPCEVTAAAVGEQQGEQQGEECVPGQRWQAVRAAPPYTPDDKRFAELVLLNAKDPTRQWQLEIYRRLCRGQLSDETGAIADAMGAAMQRLSNELRLAAQDPRGAAEDVLGDVIAGSKTEVVKASCESMCALREVGAGQKAGGRGKKKKKKKTKTNREKFGTKKNPKLVLESISEYINDDN